jgi:Tfp pilus assembly protein PilV
MTIKHLQPVPRRGFSLIEALIALVVTSFGFVALAGFQSTLSVASENAKHRAQALRLAQQKMEQLRGFEQIELHGTKFDYTGDVVSGGPETINSAGAFAYVTANEYRRQWWVTQSDGITVAAGTDPQKWIRVRVEWTDRFNQGQNVTIQSVISRAQPADLGTLAVGPGTRQPRTPKNRNVDIPYPAISLPGGKSAFTPPGSTNAYIFDNVTGDVLGFCGNSVVLTSGVDLDDSDGSTTTGCTVSKAYLLSGYIRFRSGGMPSGTEKNVDDALSNPTDATKELTASLVFPGFTSALLPAPAVSCFTQRQKVLSTSNTASSDVNTLTRVASGSDGVVTVTTAGNHQLDTGQYVSINGATDSSFDGIYVLTKLSNTSFSYTQTGLATALTETGSPATATRVQQITVAETDATPTGYTSVISRFVAYVCIVTPSDHDDDESGSPSPTLRRWWGQFVITPALTSGDSVVWTLGTGASDRKVCRFTGDYVIDNKVSNTEHPWYYRGATAALDNQNYLVIDGNQSCPTDGKVDTLNSDYINTHTLLHQTASGSAAGGTASTSSTQWDTTPETSSAPASITDVLEMF